MKHETAARIADRNYPVLMPILDLASYSRCQTRYSPIREGFADRGWSNSDILALTLEMSEPMVFLPARNVFTLREQGHKSIS
jgi:hypothetical protein